MCFDAKIDICCCILYTIIFWSYVLHELSTIADLAFPIVRPHTTFKEAMKTLVSIAVVTIFAIIAYICTSSWGNCRCII